MTDGLKDAHREAIIAVIAANDRVERAVLFGSRATETNTVTSDVDIALFGDRLTWTDQARLAAAIDKIPMAQSVDLLLYNSIRDRTLREHIRRQGIAWYERPTHEGYDSSSTLGCPGDWVSLSLGAVCTKIGSGATPRGGKDVYLPGGPYAFIRSQNVFDDGFRHDGLAYIGEQHASDLAGVEVLDRDVLLNITGDSVARACQVDPHILPARVNQHVAIIRPDPTQLDPGFLRYFLVCPETQAKLLSWAGSGGTRNALTKAMVAAFDVEAPDDLSEQRAIAHILGTLDDKIDVNRRMNETLEAIARALFKSWFVDFDPVQAKVEGRDTGLPQDIADLFPDRLVDSEMGEIPKGWQVATLAERIEVNPRRSLRKGQIAPYLPMANMPTRGHMPDAVAVRPFGSGMRFANGDTLVARITPCLENGKTAYVDFLTDGEVGWGSTEYIVLRPQPPLPNQFAYFLARSARFREFAIQNMSGTSGRQRVPPTALRGFLLVVPPGRVAARFGKIAASLFERASNAVHESRTLAALRDTLLPKLISGEIRLSETAWTLGMTDR